MLKRILFSFLVFSTLIISCGPSQADLDATALKVAEDEAASQTAEAPTPTETSVPTITPTPLPSPLEILEASMAAMKKVETYYFSNEVQMTIKSEGVTVEMSVTMKGDTRLPDSMEASLSTSLFGTTIETQMIRLGETTYAINPETGEWEISEDAIPLMDPGSFSDIDPGDLMKLNLIGMETIEETEVFHLSGVIPAEEIGEKGSELKIDYWIGIDDYLTRQINLEGEIEFLGEGFAGEEITGLVSIMMTVQMVDFGKTVVIEAPVIEPKSVQVESTFGWMTVYESNLYPFAIQYPTDWKAQPAAVGTNAQFASDRGEFLGLAEEDLIALGLGEMTLEQYGDLILSNINSYMPAPEIIGRSKFVTSNGLSGEVLEFAFEEGDFKAKRFYYLHNGSIAFNATYVAQADMFEELEPLILYSFGTFDLDEFFCDGYFPVIKQPQPLSALLMDQMIQGIDQIDISLWPEFDNEDVLVIYRIHLAPEIELPAHPVIPIPSEVGEPYAVAWENREGQLFNAEFERVVQDEWAIIKVVAEGEIVQLEYYSSLIVEEPWRYYELSWPGGISLNASSYEVLWPEGVKELEVFPPYDTRVVAPSGTFASKARLGPQMATSSFTIQFCYHR